jgi:hypothetical protein
MLKLFSVGLFANVVYVLSGAAKQYFIAAQLPVADVGVYGTWVAQASLLLVVVPLPAYLDVLIKGFSATLDDQASRHRLFRNVIRELQYVVLGSTAILACVLLYSAVAFESGSAPIALLLLLVAQYVSLTADISLRMCRAHQLYAVFLAARNLPSLVVIVAFGLQSAMAIVIVELLSGLLTGWFVYRSRVLRPAWSAQPHGNAVGVRGEQATLWLARLVQYVNAALLRLTVPFVFGAHETGLFFFACIAQIPSSLFLSVTTQLFGHSLAQMQPGGYRAVARIQLWFLAPNALYALGIAALTPYWSSLIDRIPTLAQYAGIGSLVFAVALYSSVLASDCQEYLLRSRGFSRILLQYNASSIAAQIACLGYCTVKGYSIHRTIVLSAVAAGAVLIVFTGYSFRRVLQPQRSSASP